MRMTMMAAAGLCALGCMGAVEIRPGAVDVVVEKKAPPAVRFAADELTNFLARALGAAVPVVSSPSEGRFSIVLGENEWSRAAGIDVSADPRDTFVIKTAPGRLFIAGRDGGANPLKALAGCERATLHGVYAFLEDYVGCRFYFPGELGEIVPRHASLSIPDIDRRTTPDFLIRRYYNSERDGRWFDPAVDETRAKALNWLRVRASTINIPCCHGMNKIDLVKKYAKAHPEYFALRKDGTRCTNFMGYHSSLKGYPCFSNRGLRDVVVDWCVEQAAKGAKYVDIMPNDALQPCHCADCQAAYAASGEDCPMSELVWGYTKYVADRLKEKGVDVIVTQMAYAQYRRIPRGIDIPGNVRVMVAEPGPWSLSNPGELRRQYDEIRAWKDKSGNPIWIWTYPHKYWSLAVPGLPDVAPKAWGEYYKPLKGDILGTFAESETDRWLYHYLNYYVFSRVMWNADTDVDAVLDEHHRLMFGAAAEPMKAFYETLESKWTRDLAGKVRNSPLGPVTVPPTEPEIWEGIYSRAEADRLAAMLDRAAASVAAGSLEARRIALVRREYLEPIFAAIEAYSSRREAIKALVYEAGRDGPIELRPFGVRKGREPEEYVKTTVTIRRAGDALVVRYDAEDNRMDDMQGTLRAADDPETWRDASLEIYLNPTADMKTYYHIIVNLEGSISDSKGVRTGARDQIVDSSWNSGATAKIDKRADGWTAEVRIPLAPLGEVKEAFPAEFVRNRNTRSGKGQCLYNWSPYVYGFNSLDQFGTVRLSSSGAVEIRPGAVDVVLPKKPLPTERFAADELTNFLSRVLGAPVPVVEKARAGRAAILLGRAAGFDVSALERDAFRTKVECAADGGAVIRIAGRDGNDDVFRRAWKSGATVRDECATLFGVYAFLEDFAGVRFYFPGELGTVANRRDAVVTPVQDKTTAPWFIVRSTIISRDGVWYEPLPSGWHPNAGKALCWLRHRFETARIPCCHGQNKFKIVERFAATHPEYCQLRKDGTRCTALKRERVGYHQKQLCQSSGIWSVFHDDIVASGRTGYVDVMPQDGYVPCECPDCQAKYRRNPDGSLADSYASELVWGRTAELARRFLAEGRPDLTFTQMSYGAYRAVPDVDLPTNVLVMVAVSGPWNAYNPKQHAEALERIRAWDRKTGRRVWLWTYPHKFFQSVLPGVPSFGPRAWGRFFKDAAPDITGAFCESETDHWLFHYLNYYVFSRIAWNPETDVDAVIDEHNRLMFGAGAAEMAEFFDILEEKWVKGIAGRITDTPIGPMSMPPCEYEIWTKLYSPEAIGKIEKLLSTARAKADRGTVEARRVELVVRELYGPLRKAARAYWSMCDADAERQRRAALPDDGDMLKGAKWIPCSSAARFDGKTFLSAPNSMMVTTTTNKAMRTGCFLGKVRLEPSAKYRLSYFVKCDDIRPLYNGGGASVIVRQRKSDGKGGREWKFPEHDNFLSGTTDWIPQVFEFETDESWREQPETLVYLQTRYAAGVAHFDDVRLDRISR